MIGATGTAKPGLLPALIAVLAAEGLQVRHASRRYQGETEFATGGPSDLLAELTGIAPPPEQATLEGLRVELEAFRTEFREFVGYEQEDDKKRPTKRGKAKKETKPEEQKPEEQKPEETEAEPDADTSDPDAPGPQPPQE